MEALGQLVAGISHNFNNIMTITMAYTDLLLEQDDSLNYRAERLANRLRRDPDRSHIFWSSVHGEPATPLLAAYAESVEDAVRDAEAVLLLTEWPEYVGIEPTALLAHVAVPRIIDGRNCLDPDTWRDAGWRYRALGRPRQVELAPSFAG